MKTITTEQWQESQTHEASFWQHQAKEGNKEQYHRWGWYRDVCFPSYLRRRFDGMKLMDVGSGPQGILHLCEYVCIASGNDETAEWKKEA